MSAARTHYQQRERRFVVEYVRTRYPNDPALYNVRLGPVPAKFQGVDVGGLSPNIFKVFNRYVDGAVILPDKLVLIEAKILADLGAVSQLEYYASLIPGTPELAQYAARGLDLRIVTASADPSFIEFAASRGVSVDIYRPPWAVDYLTEILRG